MFHDRTKPKRHHFKRLPSHELIPLNSRHFAQLPSFTSVTPTLLAATSFTLLQSIGNDSRRIYAGTVGDYKRFCASNGLLFVIPSRFQLALYVTHRVTYAKDAVSTMKQKISHLKHWAICHGRSLLPHQDDIEFINKCKQGISKLVGLPPPDSRGPVTFDLLDEIYDVVNWRDFNEVVLYTVMVVALQGLFRLGEVTYSLVNGSYTYPRVSHLRHDPNTPDTPFYLLHLPASKGEHYRGAVDVVIPPRRSRVDACSLLDAYIERRKKFSLISHYLSSSILLWSSSNPLFLLVDGSIVDKNAVLSFLYAKLQLLGLPSAHLKGHSFRIGGATELASRHAPDYLIQALGRWKGTSYKSYIRLSNASLAEHCFNLWSSPVTNVSRAFGFVC